MRTGNRMLYVTAEYAPWWERAEQIAAGLGIGVSELVGRQLRSLVVSIEETKPPTAEDAVAWVEMLGQELRQRLTLAAGIPPAADDTEGGAA